MKLNSYTIIGAILLVLLVLVLIRAYAYKSVKPTIHIVVYDPSNSKADGCSCLTQKVKELIENKSSGNAEVQIWELGNESTGYKPRFGGKFSISGKVSLISYSNKKDNEQQVLDEFMSKCRAIQRTNSTPLFTALETSIEQLKNQCDPESNCEIIAHTDMEESVEPRILAAFKRAKGGGEIKEIPQIDNSGIRITFTGISEVVTPVTKQNGKSNKTNKNVALEKLNDDEIWEAIWKRIFTKSDLVKIEPICAP